MRDSYSSEGTVSEESDSKHKCGCVRRIVPSCGSQWVAWNLSLNCLSF